MSSPNIVFILVDALRARSLGCYGYARNTSPVIDSIARRGVTFENTFCTVNATDPSLTTIFSGLYPRSHGILHHSDQIPPEELLFFESQGITLLPEVLKKQGYATYGLDWLGRWHRQGYDYYAGFNVDRVGRKKKIKAFSRFVEKLGLREFFRKIYALPVLRSVISKFDLYGEDMRLTDQAVDIVKTEERPFFLFIHYWGLHAPYNCPQEYVKELQKTSVSIPSGIKSFDFIKNPKYKAFYEQWTRKEKNFSDIITRHDGAIRHIDTQIGSIIDGLKAAGKLENTIIIITSDHGESLVEHGILFDHHGLYDASIHVPLIISFPPLLPQGKHVAGLVQHVDIVPTLLSLLGMKIDHPLEGYPLVPLIEKKVAKLREYAFTEENYYEQRESIRSLRHKLIRSIGDPTCTRCGIVHGDEIELYDLLVDPQEKQNIARSDPATVRKLLAELDAYKKRFSRIKKETAFLDRVIGDIKL